MSVETEQSRVLVGVKTEKNVLKVHKNNESPKHSNSDSESTFNSENQIEEKQTEMQNLPSKQTSVNEPLLGDKKCLNEVERQLTDGIANFWQSKAFSDIEIHCGIDGGVVLAHRILLASISPFLRNSLQSLPSGEMENITLLIPDISSEDINHFLNMVCGGSSEPAVVKQDLLHLGFSHVSYTKKKSCTNQKTELNNFRIAMKSDVDNKNIRDQLSYNEDCDNFDIAYANSFPSNLNMVPEMLNESLEVTETAGIERSKPNLIWTYFTFKDNRHAVCKTCSTECKTNLRNTSSLSRHLRNSHQMLYKEFIIAKRAPDSLGMQTPTKPKEAIPAVKEEANQLTCGSAKSSLVWNYFTSLQNDRTKCNSCDQEMRTFDGSTSGMLRHLRRNHEDLYCEWKSKKERRQYNTILGNSLHPIWNYFEETKEPRKYKCLICHVVIELQEMQMILLEEHLKEKHEEPFKEYNSKLTDEKVQSELQISTIGGVGVGGFHGKFSRVWELYDEIESDQAKCKECGAILKVFSNSTSGLLRHIKRHHETLYHEFNNSKKKQLNVDPNDISNIHHPIWGCVTKKEESQNLVTCKECEQEIELVGVSLPTIVNHLNNCHPERYDSYDTSMKKYIKTLTVSSSISYSKKTGIRSAIWKYFKRTGTRTLNCCCICGVTVRCNKMGTSNMIRHLERYHSNEYENFLKENSNNVISPVELTHSLPKNSTKFKKKRGPKPKDEDSDLSERTCPDCGKSFSGRAAMRFHKRVVHSGIRPFKCEECGMTFARGDSFKGHTHSKTRSFLCTICGKTFGRKNIRDQHERAHRGDRRYNCNHCNRKFMTNQQRMNHERVHTGEKPYQVVKLLSNARIFFYILLLWLQEESIRSFDFIYFYILVHRLRKAICPTASVNYTLQNTHW